MPTVLKSFNHTLQPIRSAVFKSPPDAVPSNDELEAAQAELRVRQQGALDRIRKADGDWKAIEESLRRIKEREKGKAKATERIKKERGCAYRILCERH
jgi:transcriptional adapter 3